LAEFAGVEAPFAAGLASALDAVDDDSDDLAAEPIPPLHPQPQIPSVITRIANTNESELLGLKKVGSDAWQALPAAFMYLFACNLDLQRENSGLRRNYSLLRKEKTRQ
jgi:hypothetical protein